MSRPPKVAHPPASSFTIDETGRIVTCNEACCVNFGFEHVFEFTGRNIKAFLPTASEGESLSDHPILQCARTGNAAVSHQGFFLRHDQKQFEVNYHISSVWLEWGRQGAVCVFWPISETPAEK